MSDVFALYRIQQLELDIIQQSKRIKVINATLENDASLQDAEELFNVAKTEFDDATRRAKDMELEIAALVDKQQNAETRLYSGEVKNPKELQDMQMEIESLGRRRTTLDNLLSDIGTERQDLQNALEAREQELNELKQSREEEQQELLSEKAELTDSVNGMLAQRRKAVKEIPADLYQVYNNMRTAKSNRPLAILKDNACTICGIEQNNIVITAINRSAGLVNCQNCGRILIKM